MQKFPAHDWRKTKWKSWQLWYRRYSAISLLGEYSYCISTVEFRVIQPLCLPATEHFLWRFIPFQLISWTIAINTLFIFRWPPEYWFKSLLCEYHFEWLGTNFPWAHNGFLKSKNVVGNPFNCTRINSMYSLPAPNTTTNSIRVFYVAHSQWQQRNRASSAHVPFWLMPTQLQCKTKKGDSYHCARAQIAILCSLEWKK